MENTTTNTPVIDGVKHIHFTDLSIDPKILEVLKKLNFVAPTPIQAKAIPAAISGKDVLGIAQTGTGKTLAFGVPMIEKLIVSDSVGLILVPTRELAHQVYDSLHRVASHFRIFSSLLIGGESMHRQIQSLRMRPKIIVATPGRLNDHLKQRTVMLNKVSVLVLDEADRMLDMGFAPQIKEIIKHVPVNRQTLLFTATMPNSLTTLAHSFMKSPTRIEVAPQGTTIAAVTQEIFYVSRDNKKALLIKLVEQYKRSILVFTRTKFTAKVLAEILRKKGFTANEIHSNRSMSQRLHALEGFKRGKYRILVATDIAARGIHVSDIELVLNYDMPEQTDDYVHRIGRTGRAGKGGHAISIATPDQTRDVRDIERLIGKKIPVGKMEGIATLDLSPSMPSKSIPQRNWNRGRRPYGGGGGRGQGRRR